MASGMFCLKNACPLTKFSWKLLLICVVMQKKLSRCNLEFIQNSVLLITDLVPKYICLAMRYKSSKWWYQLQAVQSFTVIDLNIKIWIYSRTHKKFTCTWEYFMLVQKKFTNEKCHKHCLYKYCRHYSSLETCLHIDMMIFVSLIGTCSLASTKYLCPKV